MAGMIRSTEEQYAERVAKFPSWASPVKAAKAPVGKKVVKMDINAPIQVGYKPDKPQVKRSEGERALETALEAANIKGWLAEYRFDPKRRWRADFAFLEARLLVEVEGGIWSGGRHTRGEGFEHDAEKYNAMTIQGWKLLRFSTGMVHDGIAIKTILDALR